MHAFRALAPTGGGREGVQAFLCYSASEWWERGHAVFFVLQCQRVVGERVCGLFRAPARAGGGWDLEAGGVLRGIAS